MMTGIEKRRSRCSMERLRRFDLSTVNSVTTDI